MCTFLLVNDLAFILKRSLKVTENGAIGFHIYNFLLVVNSNCDRNWLLFRDIKQKLALTLK